MYTISMENEFINYADNLLTLLPEGREREILEGEPEGLRPYLAGTSQEALLDPQNEKFLGSVIGVAMSRIEEKKKRG